jgi:hypothetical protein
VILSSRHSFDSPRDGCRYGPYLPCELRNCRQLEPSGCHPTVWLGGGKYRIFTPEVKAMSLAATNPVENQQKTLFSRGRFGPSPRFSCKKRLAHWTVEKICRCMFGRMRHPKPRLHGVSLRWAGCCPHPRAGPWMTFSTRILTAARRGCFQPPKPGDAGEPPPCPISAENAAIARSTVSSS